MGRVIFPNLANYTPPDHTPGTGQVYLKNDDAYLKLYGEPEKLLGGGGDGIVKQVRYHSFCDAITVEPTSSGDPEDVIHKAYSFTPHFADSLILIYVSLSLSVEDGKFAACKIYRDGKFVGLPDPATGKWPALAALYASATPNMGQVTFTFMDKPEKATPFLYGISVAADGRYHINQPYYAGTASDPAPKTLSSMVIIELQGDVARDICGSDTTTVVTPPPPPPANCATGYDFYSASLNTWVQNSGHSGSNYLTGLVGATVIASNTRSNIPLDVKVTIDWVIDGVASTDLISDYGVLTPLAIQSWNKQVLPFVSASPYCFDRASVTATWRLKWECQAGGTGEELTSTHSKTHAGLTVCASSTLVAGYWVSHCVTGSVEFVRAPYPLSLADLQAGLGASVGDIISWNDAVIGGNYCSEITAFAEEPYTGKTYLNTFVDCADCALVWGTRLEVIDCDTGVTWSVENTIPISANIGDIIQVDDKSTGTQHCATVTGTITGGIATHDAVSSGFVDCQDCQTQIPGGGGGGGQQLFEVQDCTSGINYLCDDALNTINPSVGTWVSYEAKSGTGGPQGLQCGTVQSTTTVGTPTHDLDTIHTGCNDCATNIGGGGGGGGGGSSYLEVTECDTYSVYSVDDIYSLNPVVGDYIMIEDVTGNLSCGYVTGTTENAPTHNTVSGPYADCLDCSSNIGGGGGGPP